MDMKASIQSVVEMCKPCAKAIMTLFDDEGAHAKCYASVEKTDNELETNMKQVDAAFASTDADCVNAVCQIKEACTGEKPGIPDFADELWLHLNIKSNEATCTGSSEDPTTTKAAEDAGAESAGTTMMDSGGTTMMETTTAGATAPEVVDASSASGLKVLYAAVSSVLAASM